MSGKPYKLLGLSLCVAGALFAPVAYFILASTPLAAVGMSSIMIGFTCLALSTTRPGLSAEACEMMMQTGTENIAALVEELGITSKAIYLGPSQGGRPRALIPISESVDIGKLRAAGQERLIVRCGPQPGDLAISVATPGTANLSLLESKPGPGADDIQQAVTYLLVGVLDLASAVRISVNSHEIVADIDGARLHKDGKWYQDCIGSPIASTVAAVASQALDKPLRIKEERFTRGTTVHIVLEALA